MPKLATKPYCLRLVTILAVLSCLLTSYLAKATEEPYINELKGPRVATGNSFTVADEKFGNSTVWSTINQNISVNDIVSFEINFDSSIYFYNKPFSCTLNFKIYVYGNTADSSQITDSVTYSNISLVVKYDTVTGKPYKGIALYKFKNVYKFKVKVLSLTSPNLSPIPAIFRIKGQIVVDREYNFQDASTDITRFSVPTANQLRLDWTPSNYPGAQSFDIEYTHIDDSSAVAAAIRNSYNTGSNEYTVPPDTLIKWFQNNSTRVTTTGATYLLDIPYNSGFILFRIRGVLIHYSDGVRWEGNWNYSARWSTISCTSSCPSGVVHFSDHEPSLNWQYSAVFAEEGKRKEVMSYFSGTLHNRQSVTISNTENKAIVQETIYDVLGRPAINVLPAPTNDSTLHYYRNFNRNGSGNPYSFPDFSSANGCTTDTAGMSNSSGAAKYYSANNDFLNSYYFSKYIPKADNFPFAVTEYMADNTGRISMQGGVGKDFQLTEPGHATKYFYGKPTSQNELDRLFGVEAGNYTHYLKNMVVDPNGQVSVSYIEPGGKTVATALAGAVPANVHALPSNAGAITQVNSDLVSPNDFVKDGSNYSLSASSTFLASLPGTYNLTYQIDPLKLSVLYGPNKDSVICSSCYYDVDILVKDNCNNSVAHATRSAGAVFDTACSYAGTIQGTLAVPIAKIGDYYVTYSLKVSKDALDYYDSVHLVKNSDILKFNSFFIDELKQTDFTGCYSNCQTCLDDLGTQQQFLTKFKQLYTTDSVFFGTPDSLYTLHLYDSLLSHCQSLQATCNQQSVCDEKLSLLKMDVSPGGQYALYDSNFHLVDTPTNVIARRNQISFFPDGEGGRDSVILKGIDGADSIRVDVNALSDSLFIANWKDAWADSLVRLHPEYCYYLWCIANSASASYDSEIENWMDADTARAKGWFDPANYKAILDKDPFFTTIGGVAGKGVGLYNKMRDSLQYFSRTMVGLSQADKNILQVVDISLYCKNQYNGWDVCTPDSVCRSRNREWFLYKELYLNLKQRFNEEARRTDPQFSTCTNCFIGHDLIGAAGLNCLAPPTSDFQIQYCDGDSTGALKCRKFVYGGLSPITHRLKLTYHRRDSTSGFAFFYPGNTDISVSDSAVTIADVSCSSDSIYHDFTDSTCNYRYPSGIYQPFGRAHTSLYFEYGDPNHGPSGTPAGFGNCKFYPIFNLRTGATSARNFFNAWVCVYDSTCGGTCSPAASYASECSSDSRASAYSGKIRRYPEYVDASGYLNSLSPGNPADASKASSQQILNECQSNCEAQADYWISTLKNCTTDSLKLAQLKAALIDVCSRGCSQNSAFGSSSVGYYQKIEAEDWVGTSGVVAAPTPDYGGGLEVDYIGTGAWMDYQVNVPATGVYKLNFRLADIYQMDSLALKNSAGAILAIIKAPTTHSYGVFRTVSVTVSLTAGIQTLRVESLQGGWNINWFTITGNPVVYRPIPARMEGESFDATSAVGIETTDDPQGGDLCASSYQNGAFFDFHIKVPETGTYTANLRLQCIGYLQQLQIKNSAGTVLATVPIPQTGYNNYATVSVNFNLNAGNETLRIVQITPVGAAVNWIELVKSDLPLVPFPYFSFEDAIRGVVGDGSLNNSCTVELLSNPYPKDKTPFLAERLISETDYDICQKITQNKNEWISAGDTGSFHQYLVNKFGAAYHLDSTELDDLVNSCTRCNGILNSDISLPIAFEPGAHPCLSCSDLSAAKDIFTATYPGVDTINVNYEALFTNFMNHRFGFSLSFDEYEGFMNNCTSFSSVIHVEAENYTSMNGVLTENTADAGGGLNVGWIDPGDWMDYGVTTASAGSFTIRFRIASPSGGALQVKNSAGAILATVTLRGTGGYQNWSTITGTVVLPAGPQTLRIYASSSGWNFNWFEIAKPLVVSLCDHVAQPEVETDATNSCTAELFATALTNAQNQYLVYIDSVRREFRNGYMTKCMSVQPSLKMSAQLYEYHYTLYYYDQSGNLVKTVPPEGVDLLDSARIDSVLLCRRLQSQGCYQFSDSIKFNNNGSIQFPILGYRSDQPFTVEARVNLTSSADQILVSQVTEVNTGFGTKPIAHKGYVLSVIGGKLQLSLYSYYHVLSTVFSDTAIATSNLNLSQLIPLNTWKHLALEFTGNYQNPWALYVDGNPVALQYSPNNLEPSLNVDGSPLIIGSHSAANLSNPGKLRGSIKNLRIYSRLLPIDEIRQNAFNSCQTPVNNTALVLWTPLNTAQSNIVPDLVANQNGTLTGFTWQPFVGVYNQHRLVTTYQYNSLNQVVQQYSPDGDTTWFFYDRLGRLTVSQNKEQQTTASYSGSVNRFSYTRYDSLGRITEVGEKSGVTDIRSVNMLDTAALNSWLGSGSNKQITKTVYDSPVNPLQLVGASRKRVTASIYLETASDTGGDSTLYVYDISGNVKTLLQHVKALVAVDGTNGKKRIDYDYDLVSGKVNQVKYQEGKGDQFYYKYLYDADNRVVQSLSSRDKLIWTDDASYSYYLHGPLARTEIGHWKVQGVDYAYTLQGWLKGINGDALNPSTEMAGDGVSGSAYGRVSKDVYSFKLGYYNNDYKPIGGSTAGAFDQYTYSAPNALDNTGNELFNGNISYSTLALSKFDSTPIKGYSYGYDQLNRLVEMRQHNVSGAWSNSNIVSAYAESIAYDANGNILKYLRRGANTTGNSLNMDSLSYKYNRSSDGKLVNNQLNYAKDTVSSSNYTVDIDNQSPGNYTYDHIGNLKKDVAEGIDTIRWTVYGKINRIVKSSSGLRINYGYDAGGNRTTKVVSGSADTTTFYVRDAQGNVLATYSKKAANTLQWNEQDLYGSSRLGLWRWDTIVPAAPPIAGDNSPIQDSLMIGSRNYELTNHLGNVLATISDKKIGHDSSGVANYYIAEVLSQNDYYPFGMQMPGRKYSATSSYRYGFNGKENDNEVKGEGEQQDYGMRIYDPRIGRWLSVEPVQRKYPYESPYLFSGASPLLFNDPDGKDKIVTIYVKTDKGTFPVLQNRDATYFAIQAQNRYGKMPEYVKYDVNVSIVYDFSSGHKGNKTTSSTPDYLSPMNSDFWGWLGNKTGLDRVFRDQHSQSKGEGNYQAAGYVLTGNKNGTTLDLKDRAGHIFGTIDIGSLLGAMNAANSSPEDLFEALDKNALKSVLHVLQSMGAVKEGKENYEEAKEAIKNLLGDDSGDVPESNMNQSTLPSAKPGAGPVRRVRRVVRDLPPGSRSYTDDDYDQMVNNPANSHVDSVIKHQTKHLPKKS